MAKHKRIAKQVVCPKNPQHVFTFVFEIEEGTEEVQSKVEAYCPYCDNFVQVTVKGKPPETVILRRFKDQ